MAAIPVDSWEPLDGHDASPAQSRGMDVAYVPAELRAQTPQGSKIIEGIPAVAVEILSPSDEHADVTEKPREYRNRRARAHPRPDR